MYTDNPEPRAVAADDELGQHAADPAQPGFLADLRPGHGEPEPARASSCSVRASRWSARSCGATASCPASTRARTSTTTRSTRRRIIRDVDNRHLPLAAPAQPARLAPDAEPRAPGGRAATTSARGPDRVARDGLPHAVRGPAKRSTWAARRQRRATVRRRRVRQRLPDRPPLGGARRARRPGLLRQRSALGRPRRHHQSQEPCPPKSRR